MASVSTTSRVSRGFHVKAEMSLTLVGKTAIRTLLGPLYAKVKKGPKLADEEEAKALLSKILPK